METLKAQDINIVQEELRYTNIVNDIKTSTDDKIKLLQKLKGELLAKDINGSIEGDLIYI